ncbi:hypothetical protein C8J57DRAFT_1260131 [Mycena rebaudengoi]|nr:hypothetical protein C8J57DRAFT_1260131 [Mycena rebaudengoi]
MVPHEITPEIQYIRTVTREITPEIQYIQTVRHESTPEIEYIRTVTREIEYMYTVEGGSHACDPLDYPPWTSDMDSEKKKRMVALILGDNVADSLMGRIRLDNEMGMSWADADCKICNHNLLPHAQPSMFLSCPTCRNVVHLIHKEWLLTEGSS